MVRLRGCIVLLLGNLLCVDNISLNCMFFIVENQVIGQFILVFEVDLNFWDILLDDGILYILYDNKDIFCILWFLVDNFKVLDFFFMDIGKSCIGLVIIGDVLFVVFDDCFILKMNKNG